MTGYRLPEIHFTCQICFLDTAYGYSIIIVHPCAWAILNEGCFPFLVFFFPHIFPLLQFCYTLWHQIWFDILIYFIEYLELAFIERGTCIALDTAGSLAGMQIADEVFFEQVLAHYFIVYGYHLLYFGFIFLENDLNPFPKNKYIYQFIAGFRPTQCVIAKFFQYKKYTR